MKFNYKFENKAGMTHYENDFINTKIKNIGLIKKNGWIAKMTILGKLKRKSFACKKYGNYQAKLKALKQLEEWRETEPEERKKLEQRELSDIFVVKSYCVDCSEICDICDEEYSICVCRFEWRK